MQILHGSWLIGTHADADGRFVIWAETSEAPPRAARRTSARKVRFHPFAAPADLLRPSVRSLLPTVAHLPGDAEADQVVVRLPSTQAGPEASSALLQEAVGADKGKRHLAAWRVDALLLLPQVAPEVMAALPPAEDTPPGLKVGADLAFWRRAGQLALELLARQQYAPTLTRADDAYLALWQPLLAEPSIEARLATLSRTMPPVCRAISRASAFAEHDAPGPRALLENFLALTVDAFVRWHADYGRHFPEAHTTLAEAWLEALVADTPFLQESAPNLKSFYEQYRAWSEPIPGAAGDGNFRPCFRLEPPPDGGSAGVHAPKPKARDWALNYFLQATDDPSLLVPAGMVWRERGGTLKFLDRKLHAPQERLLAGLGQASRIFSPIEASLRAARPEGCALDVNQAYTFMRETALLLQSFGFGVLVPNLSAKLGVRLDLRPKQARPAAKGGVAGLTLEFIVEYNWQLALGGEPLSEAEFERLVSLKVPLVQVRGQWVEVNPEQIAQAVKLWQKRKGGQALSLQEALRLALSPESGGLGDGLPVTEVAAEGWLGDLVGELTQGGKADAVSVPEAFQGTLRPYQVKGLAWLAFLRRWGFGACLADDMGLGKTAEMIALLLHERATGNGRHPALVICPTSVVSNWGRELARFAPGLRVMVHHGASRKKEDLAGLAAQHDVVISSYALLHRDEKHLAAVEWGEVILDEAQNIKNPGTKQAQAARRLPAAWRAALTGTPVENRLAELWSIFQFLNPGYLGSQNDFYGRFARPIERAGDAEAAGRLKTLVGPFILRRVKTDPTVINDLPAKNEIKVYCSLTKEQATLYEAVVRDSLGRIAEAEGIDRRGVILATLMKLKQVCNHPAHFLCDGSALPGRSSKLNRLGEMLEEVRAVHERALIFTQFAEMGQLLKAHLQAAFGEEVLFLHGGTPAKARDKMIARFQDDAHGPAMFILSLKAGGTGLNLTVANHVFHFDRWWNPAVEDQATDRAFRIGQTRNVQAYKYVCSGTFEEKIDDMIERKKALAASIVGASEAWITELSTDQLRDLFALRREAIPDS